MNEALKGIQADLARIRLVRENAEADYERRADELADEWKTFSDVLDERIEALESARSTLEAVAEDDDLPVKAASNGNGHSKPQEAAIRMLEQMQVDGGPKTELQLGSLAGLRGRGAHNTREAAVRLLLADKSIVLANTRSSDGSPLYVLGER
jgi:hypothetical protein